MSGSRLIIFIEYLGEHIHITVSSKDSATLGNVFLSHNEGLAPLDRDETPSLANGAFKLQSNLLCGLCLLPENGLRLPSVPLLLGIISSLSLSHQRVLTLLVLRHFVGLVLLAFLAVCFSLFWSVHLQTSMLYRMVELTIL
jgi:hypothetical protein